jgi:hypothetical protein
MSTTAVAPPTSAAAYRTVDAGRDDCKGADGQKKKKSGLGRFLGGVAGDIVSRKSRSLGVDGGEIGRGLADTISCLLSPGERKKADAATQQVVERPVGSTARWTSDTRPGVGGSSTVTSKATLADGTECKNVRKVATIDGEEKILTDRMCRAPGATGYTKKAAA